MITGIPHLTSVIHSRRGDFNKKQLKLKKPLKSNLLVSEFTSH